MGEGAPPVGRWDALNYEPPREGVHYAVVDDVLAEPRAAAERAHLVEPSSNLPGSALDLSPGRRPVAVVGALHVGASVQALCDRRRPVVDLGPLLAKTDPYATG